MTDVELFFLKICTLLPFGGSNVQLFSFATGTNAVLAPLLSETLSDERHSILKVHPSVRYGLSINHLLEFCKHIPIATGWHMRSHAIASVSCHLGTLHTEVLLII